MTSPAYAASGYVLNDTPSAFFVIGADNLYHNVPAWSSSAAVTHDANKIVVGRGYCIMVDGRWIPGVAPMTVPVADGQVRHVNRLQLC
jgi:hypothetical protein